MSEREAEKENETYKQREKERERKKESENKRKTKRDREIMRDRERIKKMIFSIDIMNLASDSVSSPSLPSIRRENRIQSSITNTLLRYY